MQNVVPIAGHQLQEEKGEQLKLEGFPVSEALVKLSADAIRAPKDFKLYEHVEFRGSGWVRRNSGTAEGDAATSPYVKKETVIEVTEWTID